MLARQVTVTNNNLLIYNNHRIRLYLEEVCQQGDQKCHEITDLANLNFNNNSKILNSKK